MPSPDFSDVVVHIGYHKTGSTLLQRRVFLPEHGVHSPWPQDFYQRRALLLRPDADWPRRVREAFVPQIEAGREAGLVPVLSCEALSGDVWRSGQANGYGNFHVAELLATAFPGARIVIVHREQVGMVTSLYKHSIRSHWRYRLEDFVDQEPLQRGMAPVFNLSYLEYSHLLAHYHALFGRDRVFALAYEHLYSPEHAAAQWTEVLQRPVDASWLHVQVNPGMAAATIRAKRLANFAMPAGPEPNQTRSGRLVNRLAGFIDRRMVPDAARHRSDAALRRRVEASIADRFVADNARLRDLTGEDWTALGYR